MTVALACIQQGHQSPRGTLASVQDEAPRQRDGRAPVIALIEQAPVLPVAANTLTEPMTDRFVRLRSATVTRV